MRFGSLFSGIGGIDLGLQRAGMRVPNRVDRIASLGNAVVPQIAEWIGRRILNLPDEGTGDNPRLSIAPAPVREKP